MTGLVWGAFLALFLTLLVLDLSVLHREAAELSVKQALFETFDEICKPGTILATTTSSLPGKPRSGQRLWPKPSLSAPILRPFTPLPMAGM